MGWNRLEHSHDPEDIRQRLAEDPNPSYLRDAILGGIDGCVTTVAVIASVAGAGLPGMIAFVLGIASLIADAFSMGVSNYQAVKSDDDARDRLREQEERHIELDPEGEREEIRQIFGQKGFEGQTLDKIVETISANHRLWVNTMIQEEFGHPLSGPSPWKAATATFAVFIGVGLIPLLPFIAPFLAGMDMFIVSGIAAVISLFGIGWVKGLVLGMSRFRAGMETLAMGGGAALLAFLLGFVFEPMLGDLRVG
ncbi:VIT1/CCC1 family predicted Fe2+/Mn2+ transporter [Halospina denitrificans]|uniref:VIT1/CCC1 family predicted Fe2+/Mn2+ transporter n=1 Tax=Halospina denitrificans TaxID=332522 RepID=A0A4R7JGZ1_9GAMM|nr:VIT1/CCC1 transporter family protein [Halospina denitrificans]TDT37081.1 VIT1/CCC1 family predicted Fe2+/Mn2+ transporter [Halospina denitrificans]